jgi:hypothetical protein
VRQSMLARPVWRRATLRGVVACVGVATATTGCTSGGSSAAPSPSSRTTATVGASATPSPSSSGPLTRDQAIAEAKAAYIRFVQVTDDIYSRGGKNAQPDLGEVASEKASAYFAEQFDLFSANGYHAIGRTRVVSMEADSVSIPPPSSTAAARVVLITCTDAPKTYAVDAAGRNLKPKGATPYFKGPATMTRAKTTNGDFRWLVSDFSNPPVKKC